VEDIQGSFRFSGPNPSASSPDPVLSLP